MTTVLLASVVGVVLLVVGLECALRLGRWTGDEEPNAYVRDLRAAMSAGDRYVDALFPHPYLGWVHHGNAPGGMAGVNNVGLFGRDFPSDKDPRQFTILVTGGSVAAQFAQDRRDHPCYLEEELNRHYTAPDGRPVVVLNGGAGAWKQPQQAILFLMHCDIVDAVVTLDGWNEHYALTGGSRLEVPATNFHAINPVATGSHRQIVGTWLSGEVERWVRRHPLLARSRVAGLGAAVVRRAVYRRLIEPPPGARRTTVESLFALPPHYGPAEVFHHAIRTYAKYIAAIDAIARRWGVKTAHFLQPAPALGKALTEEEQAVVGDLSYGPRYEKMVLDLLSLRRVGIPMFSLTDVFAGCRETIYSDWTHMVREPGTGESLGLRLMAERIAAQIAAEWGLVRRPDAEAPPACEPARAAS